MDTVLQGLKREVPERLGEPECVKDGVPVGLMEGDLESVPLGVAQREAESEALRVRVTVVVGQLVLDREGVGHDVGVVDWLVDTVSVREDLELGLLKLAETRAEAVCELVMV
jgi:hypothetical protein